MLTIWFVSCQVRGTSCSQTRIRTGTPRYFKDVDGKLVAGGCFTAHNVLDPFAGIAAFLDYVRGRPNYQTVVDRTSRSGISISCKQRG